METLEVILVVGGIAAILAMIVGLPATYGVFLRQELDADWKKLPLLLRFSYFGEVDLKKRRDKKGWLSQHPEMLSLGTVVLILGTFGWAVLPGIFEVDEQTGELQVNGGENDVVVILPVSLVFWWVVFTFGTEWWLKRKWLPKHVIQDEAEQ